MTALPQIVRGMSPDAYRAASGLNFSTMREMLNGPAYYVAALKAPPLKVTAPITMGNCLHARTLEGRDFPHVVAAEGMEFRSNANKAWRDSQTLPILKHEEEQACQRMIAAVRDCEEAQAILRTCDEREVSVFAEFEGLKLKARFDAVNFKARALVDLKSTSAKNSREWGDALWERGYLLQKAWYELLFCLVARTPIDEPPAYRWIAAQNCEPHAVCIFPATPAQSEIGRGQLRDVLDRYAGCQASGRWHESYFPLPKWAGMESVA